jgi:hypothetical protein
MLKFVAAGYIAGSLPVHHQRLGDLEQFRHTEVEYHWNKDYGAI